MNERMELEGKKRQIYFHHQDDKQAVSVPSQALLRDQIMFLVPFIYILYCILT